MSLELVIDPVDCHFPQLVKELLYKSPDPGNRQISTALNPNGFAYFLHDETIYLWSCLETDKKSPPYCLTLPSSGSKVSTSMIAMVERTDNPLPSVMAVSPEGKLRYWDNLGDSEEFEEKQVKIVNDVVHSVVPFGSNGRIYRYLVSTATGSFYHITVFKCGCPKIGNKPSIMITVRQLMHSREPFTRSSKAVPSVSAETAKEKLVKTLVADRLVNNVDVVAVYQSAIDFYSTQSNVVTDKVDLTDFILQDVYEADLTFNPPECFDKIKEAWQKVCNNRSIYVVDAISSNGGLLLLVAAEKPDQRNLTFALVFLTAEAVKAKKSSWVHIVDLPDEYAVDKTTQFHASVYTPTPSNFVIVFPTMVAYLETIDGSTTISRIAYYLTFTEPPIGTACVGTFAQIIMKRRGICNLRHLPRGFDTRFWQKYGPRFDSVSQNPTTAAEAIAYVFTLFAQKKLSEARFACAELMKQFPDKTMLVETIIFMTQNMLTGKPLIDPRWNQNPPDSPARVKISSAMSAMTHVNDKMSYYKMIVMFVRYFGYIENFSSPTFASLSPLAVMAEFGEKMFAMKAVVSMTYEMFCPNIESAIDDVGADIQRSLSMTDDKYKSLNAKDYFAKEVTSFPALIPVVLKKQQQEIDRKGPAYSGNDVWEVTQMFTAIAQSINTYRGEEWTIKPHPNERVLTNSPDFLAQFLFQFNMIFDVLDNRRCTAVQSLVNSAITIGRFLLDKQSRYQLDRSSIIQRFHEYGNIKVALQLAQDYRDFPTLLQLCHQQMPAIERRFRLTKYQALFNSVEFDQLLREYQKEHYQEKYPDRHADRAESFLVKHPDQRWIQNVEKKEYGKAKTALKTNADSMPNAQNKKTVLALAKLAALCDDTVDNDEVNQLTNAIALLEHQEKIDPNVLKSVNPTNAPMSFEAIVNANLSGGDKESFFRALLALTTIIDTAEVDKLDTFRTRIWSTVVKADPWEKAIRKSTITSSEEFEARVNKFFDDSMLTQVSQQLYLYDLPNNLKMQLLPQSTAPLKKLYQFDQDWAQSYFGEVLDTAFDEFRRHLNKKKENPTV